MKSIRFTHETLIDVLEELVRFVANNNKVTYLTIQQKEEEEDEIEKYWTAVVAYEESS